MSDGTPALNLAALMSFIKQPQSQAKPVNLQSLMLPYPGQQGGAERRDKERQASLMAEKVDEIYGIAPTTEEVTMPYAMGDMERIEGEPSIPGLQSIEQQAIPGTGMYDTDIPVQQRIMNMNKRMLGAGVPGLTSQWAKNQAAMQSARLSGIAAMDREKYKSEHPGISTAGKMAIDAGYKPGTPGYAKFVSDYATKSSFERGMDKPFSTSELGQWMTADNKDIPPGSTPMDAKRYGYQLRNKASAEGGGKIAMLDTALQQLPIIQSKLFNPDMTMNKRILGEMWAEDMIGLSKVFTSSESQEIYAAFETGMQAITRTETGAAMAKEEIENTKKRFMPHPLASDAANQQKLKAYQYFLTNAIDLLNPTGRGNKGLTPQEIMDKAVNASMSAIGAVETKRGEAPIELPGAYDDPSEEAQYQEYLKTRNRGAQ